MPSHCSVSYCSKVFFAIHKDIFACLFSIHNTIRLSCHEQVCLSGFKVCFTKAHLNMLVHDMINVLYYFLQVMCSFYQVNLFRIIFEMPNIILHQSVPCYIALPFGQKIPENISVLFCSNGLIWIKSVALYFHFLQPFIF